MSDVTDQAGNFPADAVRVRGVTKHFGEASAKIRALRGVDLTIAPNQLLMLVGPSGCGKTTLLSIICGLLAPDHGEVEVFGVQWSRLTPAQQIRRRGEMIGYVFQQFNLIPTLRVAENVAVPLLIRGVKRPQALERAHQTLKQVGLEHRGAARPTNLSGGEQQRVAIARAMVGRPRLLVADEPTANLDSRTGQRIIEMIKAFTHTADHADGSESRCVIVVTHDARLFPYADRIEQMEDGRIVGPLDPAQHDPSLVQPAHPAPEAERRK